MIQPQITPASSVEAKGALKALFEAFPADRGEGTLAVGTYFIAIEGYSLKAIEAAVKRIIRGEISDIDKRFLPTPAQFSNVVAYCEKLYAPVEKRIALPAPGDIEPTEEEWARRKEHAREVRERFGIKTEAGETVTDREAVPEARLAELDRAVAKVAAKIKAEGWPKLSAEALRTCIPDPSEQYDAWLKAQGEPTPSLTETNGRRAA